MESSQVGMERWKGNCRHLLWSPHRYVIILSYHEYPTERLPPAPGLAACFGIVVYSLLKFGVLLRDDPTRWGLFTAPIVFFTVGAVLTMAIGLSLLSTAITL